jgi:hypothetical protein
VGTVTIAVGGLTKTIAVTQAAGAATLSVPSTTDILDNTNGTSSITITSNSSWTVVSDQPWLTVSPMAGTGNAFLTLTVTSNLSASSRTAKVTISVLGIQPQVITVTQRALIIASIYKKWNNVLICDNREKEFASYQWCKDGNDIVGATGQYYEEKNGLSGSYFVKITTIDGFVGISNTISTSSVSKTIRLYPNPVGQGQTSRISINASQSEMDDAQLMVSAISGKVVLQTHVLSSDIILPNLAKGSYIVQVKLKDGSSYNEKLVIY